MKNAFKEWAVICEALAEGRQALILRKGGIAETDDEFRPEQTRFWLYPTYTHQQGAGIKEEALPLLAAAEADRPPTGIVRVSHFADVAAIYHVEEIIGALLLNHLHIWSEETVRARFEYRQPGLYILVVRVYQAAGTYELPDAQVYAGCHSWVELEQDLPVEGARPVMKKRDFHDLLLTLDRLLNPTALA